MSRQVQKHPGSSCLQPVWVHSLPGVTSVVPKSSAPLKTDHHTFFPRENFKDFLKRKSLHANQDNRLKKQRSYPL